MDYASIASKIIEQVGGKDNIRSVQRCSIPFRFRLKNPDLRKKMPSLISTSSKGRS